MSLFRRLFPKRVWVRCRECYRMDIYWWCMRYGRDVEPDDLHRCRHFTPLTTSAAERKED